MSVGPNLLLPRVGTGLMETPVTDRLNRLLSFRTGVSHLIGEAKNISSYNEFVKRLESAYSAVATL